MELQSLDLKKEVGKNRETKKKKSREKGGPTSLVEGTSF